MSFFYLSMYASEKFSMSIPREYVDYFMQQCLENNVSIPITYLLVQSESEWKNIPKSKNINGSYDIGLMRLNSRYLEFFAKQYNNGKRFDPYYWKDNLRIGIAHFAFLHKKLGNYFDALASYNMGEVGYFARLRVKKPLPDVTIQKLKFIFGETKGK